jgi:hypothetical protein
VPEPFAVAPELANTYWGQLVTSEPGFGARDRVGAARPVAGNTARVFNGGRTAPVAAQMTPQIREALRSSGGSNVTEKQGQRLIELGWKYGDPAPKGFAYDSFGRIADEYTLAQGLGQVALAAAPLAATAITAGAASPWLAATVGGATSLAAAKGQGASWKNALIAGGVGAATAGLAASALSSPVRAAAQGGVNVAGTAAQGGSLRDSLLSGGVGAAAASQGNADPTGVRADVARVAARTGGDVANSTLTQTLTNAGLAAAAGYANGGTAGALLAGAGAGVAGATAGSSNPATVQAGQAAQQGTSLASRLMSGAQVAGQAMGNAAAARESGRQTETNNLVSQDQQRLQAQIAEENARQGRGALEINQREDSRAGTNDAYKNALRANLLLGSRDVVATRPTGVPNISFTGSGRPSQLGAGGRQAAEVLAQQSIEKLMNPEAHTALPELDTFTPSALPQANGVDTALGIGGAIASGLSAFQAQRQASDQNALIRKLLEQSQGTASAGLTPPAAAAPAPTVRTQVDDVGRRVTGLYDDEPWMGGN